MLYYCASDPLSIIRHRAARSCLSLADSSHRQWTRRRRSDWICGRRSSSLFMQAMIRGCIGNGIGWICGSSTEPCNACSRTCRQWISQWLERRPGMSTASSSASTVNTSESTTRPAASSTSAVKRTQASQGSDDGDAQDPPRPTKQKLRAPSPPRPLECDCLCLHSSRGTPTARGSTNLPLFTCVGRGRNVCFLCLREHSDLLYEPDRPRNWCHRCRPGDHLEQVGPIFFHRPPAPPAGRRGRHRLTHPQK